mmetsp:Transcript_8898/g.23085  ORF Transcript_8898/g.23085 Transcript_8898/m.23085 type:complete len:402 (-) Transcript_8898:327-1532(-)
MAPTCLASVSATAKKSWACTSQQIEEHFAVSQQDLRLRGVDGLYLEKAMQFCDVCQAYWEGPPESRLVHEGGKKHRARLLAEANADNPPSPSDVLRCQDDSVPLIWRTATFGADVGRLAHKLCALGPLGAGVSAAMPRRGARRAVELQGKMRQGLQRREDFEDADALWGYAMAKLPLRAQIAFDALSASAPPAFRPLLAGDGLRVCALGGGPAAELLAVVAARDVAGGTNSRLAVFDLVDGWRPIVAALASLLDEPIEYHHCDVTRPLDDTNNAALLCAGFDLAIFSYVLLEAERASPGTSLTLLRDLWSAWPTLHHVLVLDAGQARGGRSRREGRLAGSLGLVESLASELGADLHLVEGEKKTEGLFLSRKSRGNGGGPPCAALEVGRAEEDGVSKGSLP